MRADGAARSGFRRAGARRAAAARLAAVLALPAMCGSPPAHAAKSEPAALAVIVDWRLIADPDERPRVMARLKGFKATEVLAVCSWQTRNCGRRAVDETAAWDALASSLVDEVNRRSASPSQPDLGDLDETVRSAHREVNPALTQMRSAERTYELVLLTRTDVTFPQQTGTLARRVPSDGCFTHGDIAPPPAGSHLRLRILVVAAGLRGFPRESLAALARAAGAGTYPNVELVGQVGLDCPGAAPVTTIVPPLATGQGCSVKRDLEPVALPCAAEQPPAPPGHPGRTGGPAAAADARPSPATAGSAVWRPAAADRAPPGVVVGWSVRTPDVRAHVVIADAGPGRGPGAAAAFAPTGTVGLPDGERPGARALVVFVQGPGGRTCVSDRPIALTLTVRGSRTEPYDVAVEHAGPACPGDPAVRIDVGPLEVR